QKPAPSSKPRLMRLIATTTLNAVIKPLPGESPRSKPGMPHRWPNRPGQHQHPSSQISQKLSTTTSKRCQPRKASTISVSYGKPPPPKPQQLQRTHDQRLPRVTPHPNPPA